MQIAKGTECNIEVLEALYIYLLLLENNELTKILIWFKVTNN